MTHPSLGLAKPEPPPSGALSSVFLLLAITMILSILVMFLTGNVRARADREVIRFQGAIDQLRETLSTIKDAETGQRGYLLTGDESYLEPYTAAKGRIKDRMSEIAAEQEAGHFSAANVEKLKAFSATKFEELDRTIRLRRDSGFEAALAVVKGNSGKETMDAIRSVIHEMMQSNVAKAKAGQARSSALTSFRSTLFLTCGLINLGFLFWAFRRITHEIEMRAAASAEVLEQRQLLSVTLASIGDGVIVTDHQSRITFMNSVAEELTGWSESDAIGSECGKIFNIINESTRVAVQSPVEKVLKFGKVVGLANHTVLIRKDSREIPIDDSGAPIRDEKGQIRGVVLVFRDFSEHKSAEIALRLAMEDAQAANIAKDNFLATLSHELRTPLTPVVVTLANWCSMSDLPANWREDVEMMRRNLDLEARLIDDLLDLTRIVRGKLSLNPTVADVNALIESVAGMYQSEIQAKKLHLSLDLKAARHHVYADPARLQQVFLNVLKNAAKFTPEGGAISVNTANDVEGSVLVHIQDTGIGMSESLIAKLFHPFEQGSDEVVRRYGGLGLGMAISKALMEAQGGSIQAESDGPGEGSTFSVSLPSVEATGKRDPQEPNQLASPQIPLKILLVEDHFDTARALSRLLERWGHSVTCSATVESAIGHLDAVNFDLLLSDIGLPDGTGIDLIKKVRIRSAMPAIALSGFGMEEDVNDCQAAGFDEHLTKPINFQRLETIIQNLSLRKDSVR